MTAPTLDALVAAEPDFVQGLQGYASFCETLSRGQPEPDDLLMLADKFRDAAVVITLLQKLRDELRAQVETLTAERDRYKRRGDNHAETLRGIARMKPDEADRMQLWARDGLSGYTCSAESALLEANNERNEANARALASDTARASAETALAEASTLLLRCRGWLMGVLDSMECAAERQELRALIVEISKARNPTEPST